MHWVAGLLDIFRIIGPVETFFFLKILYHMYHLKVKAGGERGPVVWNSIGFPYEAGTTNGAIFKIQNH